MSDPSLFSSSLPLKEKTGIIGREELRQSMACFQLKGHWNRQKEVIPVFPFIFILGSPLVLRWEEEDLVEVFRKTVLQKVEAYSSLSRLLCTCTLEKSAEERFT